jgi:hypothetical protein
MHSHIQDNLKQAIRLQFTTHKAFLPCASIFLQKKKNGTDKAVPPKEVYK